MSNTLYHNHKTLFTGLFILVMPTFGMAKTIINIPDEVMINRIVIETRADSIPQTKKTIEKPDENKPVIKEVPKARPKLKPAVVEPIINVPVKIIKPKIKVLN